MSELNARAHAALKPAIEAIDGARAAELITAAEAEDVATTGFDQAEASRLNVRLNQTVSITPEDNGKHAYSLLVGCC